MNASWEKDSAAAGDSVQLTGSYDAHEAGVALKVEVYGSADASGSAPNSGATAVTTVDATEAEDHASFTATWQVQAPASGSDGFVFYVSLADGSQSALSSKLSVAAAAPAAAAGGAPAFTSIAPTSGPAAGSTDVTIAGASLGQVTSVEIGGVAITGFAVNADGTQITGTTGPHDAGTDPLDVVLKGDPSGDVTGTGAFTYSAPAAGGGGPAKNLQWQQADGTAITTAKAGDSVSLSFDLAHDDQNQVTVNVLGSDKTSQVATATSTERNDQTGFSAAWIVADPGDSFFFQVAVTNPSAQPAPDPVLSDALTIGEAPPARDYYYPPDEKPVFDYVVKVTPQPPADSGTCNYHQAGETGTVLKSDVLVTQGSGRLNVNLSSFHAAQDSPLFLEFAFKKDGHDDQGSSRAVALADPAPGTVDVPADPAKPGDAVQLQVTAWNAIVYDTAGTGTAKPESETTRISSDLQAAVQWRVGGKDLDDKGTQISYTIPSDASADLDVEAFLPVSQAFPAKATLKLAAAAAGAGDWTAAWSTTTAQEDATVQMVLTAPGLAVGSQVTFEVTQDGVGSLGKTTASAEDGKASVDWSDWFHDDLVVSLASGDKFNPATFSFKASTSGPDKSAQTTAALTYADRLHVQIVDEKGEPLKTTAFTVHSPWGDLDVTTDGDGVLDVTIPPGGAHVSNKTGVAMGSDAWQLFRHRRGQRQTMSFQCDSEALVKKGQPKVTADADGYIEGDDASEKDKNADYDMLRFKIFFASDKVTGSDRPATLKFTIKEGARKKTFAPNQPPVMPDLTVEAKKAKFLGYRTAFVYVYRVVPSLDVTATTADGQVLETKHFVVHAPLNTATPAKLSVESGEVSIAPADPWLAPKYPTLASLLTDAAKADPLVKRRLAVLAIVKALFPCTNNDGEILAGADLKDQFWQAGPFKDYDGGNDPKNVNHKVAGATDCTTIHGKVMYDSLPKGKRLTSHRDATDPDWKKDKSVWAFGCPKNVGWVQTGGQLPSVGDAYVLSDKASGDDNGHVGVLIEVPADGNGLWITADGGQGGGPGSKTQIGYFVPRWGLTGDNLPTGKDWPPANARDEARPWFGNDRRVAESGDVDPAAPDRIAAVRKKLQIMAGDIPNPRRLKGYVDLDKVDAAHFDVVDGAPDPTIDGYRASVTELQAVIAQVKESFFAHAGPTTGKQPAVT